MRDLTNSILKYISKWLKAAYFFLSKSLNRLRGKFDCLSKEISWSRMYIFAVTLQIMSAGTFLAVLRAFVFELMG